MGAGFRYRPYWSPDSKKVAFVDEDKKVYVFDVESRSATQIDEDMWMTHGGLNFFQVSWSPDSRWLAYSRALANRKSVIFLYDARENELHQATSGFYDDTQPRFDPDGKYLYALTNRSLQPVYSDFDNTWVYPNATNIAAIPLRADVASPLAPRNDEEQAAAADEDEGGDEGGDDEEDAGGKR